MYNRSILGRIVVGIAALLLMLGISALAIAVTAASVAGKKED